MTLARRKKIIVLHLAGQYPLAGVAFQALHYVVGLQRLGYDAYYIEDSGSPPYNPLARTVVDDSSYNVSFIERMMERFDLADHWAYWNAIRDTHYGLSPTALRQLFCEADALIDVCGGTWLREEHLKCPVRIYLETDPARPQIELAQGNEKTKAVLSAHTHHFTYAENLARCDCPLPVDGFHWYSTRPPVILDLWPFSYTPNAKKFTTVATLEHDTNGILFQGERYYWSKHINFTRFQDIAAENSQLFEIAAQASQTAIEELVAHGWSIIDALDVSLDLSSYQNYIAHSRGEFTVAKDVFARTRTGWFSDRSVCYLAMGKPVVTLETAFSKFVPTGHGLFAFDTLDQVREAIREINRDYAHHCRAARDLAAEHFSAEGVLTKLLEDAGLR
jgi:hypothetical protein